MYNNTKEIGREWGWQNEGFIQGILHSAKRNAMIARHATATLGRPCFVIVDALEVDVVEGDEELDVDVDDVVEVLALGFDEVEFGAIDATAPLPLNTIASDGCGMFVTACAAERKVWKDSGVGGLITPTMPSSQCDRGDVFSQKYHIGCDASVTVRFHTTLRPDSIDVRPLLKPPSSCVHGVAKDD